MRDYCTNVSTNIFDEDFEALEKVVGERSKSDFLRASLMLLISTSEKDRNEMLGLAERHPHRIFAEQLSAVEAEKYEL